MYLPQEQIDMLNRFITKCDEQYVNNLEIDETEGSTEIPLVSIMQEVKYTVVIKGITFNFTQEELDDLAEELLGFTTL